MPRTRIRVAGVPDRGPIGRMIEEHASGARKVRPLVDYQPDPLGFLVDVLSFPRHTLVWSENPGYDSHTWDGTPDPLVRICDVLGGKVPGKKHVAVEAATGTQKTYTAAGLVLWALGCFEDALVVTTAPMEKQLRAGLWKEIGIHLPAFKRRFPRAESLDLKVRMRPAVVDAASGNETRLEKWIALGWCAGVDAGSDSAVRSQGFHAQHMFVFVEECPGMDPPVLTAFRNTLVAEHNVFVAVGNPDNQLDPLHQLTELPGVEAIRISAYDHPNVVTGNPDLVQGATTQGYIDTKLTEYGKDGPLFLSRVRGQSPKEAHNALIKHAWLVRAAERWEDVERRTQLSAGQPLALGVDAAQTANGDRCAIARWRGSVLELVEAVPSSNALEFGKHVWDVMQAEHVAPEHVGVDSVGIGSNVVNYLWSVLPPGKNHLVVRIEGGADEPADFVMHSPPGAQYEYQDDANRFLNMRAQVYWQLAQDLAHDLVAIPRHDGLWRELLAPTYRTEGGVVRLEKKDSIIKKLGRSPDFADAAVYGNWVRPRAADRPGIAPDTIHEPGRDPVANPLQFMVPQRPGVVFTRDSERRPVDISIVADPDEPNEWSDVGGLGRGW